VELPHIEKLYRELKSAGFGLVTVTSDPASDVLKMVDHHQITHPIVSDTKEPKTGMVFEKYHAYDGKHYLIGSNGKILLAFSKLGISIPILMRELAKHGIGEAAQRAAPPAPAAPSAQAADGPVKWTTAVGTPASRPGGALSVAVTLDVDEGWHVYAITQGPGGPVPMSLSVPKGQPFALAGKIQSPAPTVKFDPNFRMDVEQHQGRAKFVVPIAVAAHAKPGRQALAIDASYQVCNATICLPPEMIALKIPITISK
jgi:hypothetical protein